MESIVPQYVVDFIRQMVPERSSFLKDMERQCRAEWIPLVESEVGQFLQVLLKIKQARRILEIGTGIGYSTILMASVPGPAERSLTTVEIDPDRFNRACANFTAAGVEKLITPIWGDAREVIPTLDGTFDFIFVDAAKGQYPELFDKLLPLLEPGGLFILDNIFLSGWVIKMSWPERRKKTMVCRVRHLLETLKTHPQLTTSILPLGDGISLSVRSADS